MLSDKEGVLLVQSFLEMFELKNNKIWRLKHDLYKAENKIADLEEEIQALKNK